MATIQQVQELKAKMREERASLVAAAALLTPEEALKVPVDAEGEEQWTALEQLAHLWEMERSYDAWVRAAVAESRVDLANVRGEPVAIPIEAANRHTVSDLLRALEVERAHTEGLIDGLALEAYDNIGVSPVFGPLTVLQWLRSFYRHDRQHGAQIQGRASDYKPQFKGTEPNQRQARIELVARRNEGGTTR